VGDLSKEPTLSTAVLGQLPAVGWNDRVLALFNDLDDPSLEPARVCRVERSACIVATATADRAVRQPSDPVAVGDWVALDGDVIRAVIPRWSVLARSDPDQHGVQLLAANVDLVFVAAPLDRLSPARVERELTVAWQSGALPCVVVTKCDDPAPETVEALERRLVGVDVVATSAVVGRGVDDLRALLRPGRTAVLLGPSGAGKSTLANALVGEDLLATGAVRGGDHRGRHTTTARQLVAVPGGGVLIDTPGLRSLSLAGAPDVDAAFPDVEALSRRCRFSDCRHEQEPACAVTAAVADGTLDRGRLDSYRKLQREVDADRRRFDPAAREAYMRVWKARAKASRHYDKRRLR
jgi:ribosome biogenesis GTPase